MEPLLEQLLGIARQAATEILEVYRQPFEVAYKGPRDPVTEADRRANQLICGRLQSLFPGVPVVAEESPESDWGQFRKADRVFFVDPLDGTREFVARSDQFVVMIGLLDGARPSHGVLYSPVTQIAWLGAVGREAIQIARDGSTRTLRIQPSSSLETARVVASRGHPDSLLERSLRELAPAEIVPMHSAGLKGAAVASGQADIYLAPESAGCRWDSCAPEAIITAAGGVYTDALGHSLDYRAARLENDAGIVAASPKLHSPVIARLQSMRASL